MATVLDADTSKINRADFPSDFIFGAATSSYQVEGGAREGGRGPSIFDTFTHWRPDQIKDWSNGDMAVNSYLLYKEDVKILKLMGLDAYRFSISWPRILPGGNIIAGINEEGINHYNNLIDELLANDIQPFVTLFNFDVPQPLQDEYGGFLGSYIVDDFCEFVELCFWEFGDRVKNWITLNDPWTFSHLCGNVYGIVGTGRRRYSGLLQPAVRAAAPSRAARLLAPNNAGDQAKEKYVVAHNQLLSHAAAVQIYRNKFQKSQQGKIGITLVSEWMEPLNGSNAADLEAASRAFDFLIGWFMEPLISGDYPKSMRDLIGSHLPQFTPEQSKLLMGSYDFVGVNHYTSTYVSNTSPGDDTVVYDPDAKTYFTYFRNGKPIGPKGASDWLYIVPEGIHNALIEIKERYNDPVIYITENVVIYIYIGVDEVNEDGLTLSEACVDTTRTKYIQNHLFNILTARHEGVRVQGYFVWSLMDNWEYGEGFTVRFGLIHVNYTANFARYPKESAIWFRNAFHKRHRRPLKKRIIQGNGEEHGSSMKKQIKRENDIF